MPLAHCQGRPPRAPSLSPPGNPAMTILVRSLLVLIMTAALSAAADRQVQHLVMFTWKEGTTQEQADAIAKALTGLKAKVPGIVSLSYGKQNSNEDAAKKHGFQY